MARRGEPGGQPTRLSNASALPARRPQDETSGQPPTGGRTGSPPQRRPNPLQLVPGSSVLVPAVKRAKHLLIGWVISSAAIPRQWPHAQTQQADAVGGGSLDAPDYRIRLGCPGEGPHSADEGPFSTATFPALLPPAHLQPTRTLRSGRGLSTRKRDTRHRVHPQNPWDLIGIQTNSALKLRRALSFRN